MSLGLNGMIDDLIERTFRRRAVSAAPSALEPATDTMIARMLSALEDEVIDPDQLRSMRESWRAAPANYPLSVSPGRAGGQEHRDRRVALAVHADFLSAASQCLPSIRRVAVPGAPCSVTASA